MTRLTVLNGITDDSFKDFEEGLKNLFEENKEKFSFSSFTLRDMDINYCCGCWSCWVKTPGKCIHEDDMTGILKSVINSDLTIFISPVRMGYVSAYMKKVNDRMIPLLHPYIEIDHKECHHMKRYDNYPKLGLVLVDKDIDSLKDLDIIVDAYKRFGLNMKGGFGFSVLSNGSVEGLKNEIDNI